MLGVLENSVGLTVCKFTACTSIFKNLMVNLYVCIRIKAIVLLFKDFSLKNDENLSFYLEFEGFF